MLPVATGRARAVAEALVKEADPASLVTIRRLPATDPAEYLEAIRKELEEAGHDSKWYAARHRRRATGPSSNSRARMPTAWACCGER